MKIAVVRSNGMLDKKIERVLVNNNLKGEFIDRATFQTVMKYQYIIFSSDNNIPNLPKLIEQIVIEKKAIVLYVTKTLSVGQFYNVNQDLYFNIVNEGVIDVELKHAIEYAQKYIHYITNLQHDNARLKEQVNVMKLTNKAKRVLMSKGLNEEESHQFIQKRSMDMRIPRKKLVNLIIENKIDI